MRRRFLNSLPGAAACLGLGVTLMAGSQSSPAPDARKPQPEVPRLTARTVRVYEAPDADQGVAAGPRHFFVVDNSALVKYDITSGRLLGRWTAPDAALVRHLNSCLVEGARIWCANSNYPLTPMGSSVEVFDADALTHVDSHSLGMRDEGSLTFLDRYRGGWLAGFAHYDSNGGVPFKTHVFSSVVTFDGEWRKTGGWLFPQTVLQGMAPYAASGGAVGPDGWLYLLGHDLPEMYVVGRPVMGPTMIHLATIDLEAEGQAFSWAQDGSRTIFTIDRPKGLVRRIELPVVAPPDARRAAAFR